MKIIHRFFFGAMILFGIGCAASLSWPIADPRADYGRTSASNDPGCTASTLVSTGGAFPKNSRTLAIRWTGYTNYELAYNGQPLGSIPGAEFARAMFAIWLGAKPLDEALKTQLLHCS